MVDAPRGVEQRAEQLWQRLERWYSTDAPPLLDALRPGASDSTIARTEETLGVRLPDDLRSVYRVHDGGFLFPYVEDEMLSLERMAEKHTMMGRVQDAHRAQGLRGIDPASHPFWSTSWLPFVGASSLLCVDVGSTYGPPTGQVVRYESSVGGRGVVHASLLDWLEHWTNQLEAGLYYFDDEDDCLVLTERGRS